MAKLGNWTRDYRSRLVREDLRELELVKDIGTLEKLAIRLPDLVGSPLSINAIREDLGVAHQTISRWIEIFERLFSIFRIYPFGAPSIRAVKKEAKHYHYDWTQFFTTAIDLSVSWLVICLNGVIFARTPRAGFRSFVILEILTRGRLIL